MSANNFFSIFLHIQNCLKIHQLYIIEIIKKDHQKKAHERYQNLSKEEKDKKQFF